ncbi:hypothetical protein C5167_022026 [Papaver somniferum]|uniref:Uncharacterized protein n=1 Tax=Papaver somniferum TaxID=3469 RepID=A0A4Y7JJY0_PAPSO|nr:hypothetical protein C5167_022026 [Papaver somniferum]
MYTPRASISQDCVIRIKLSVIVNIESKQDILPVLLLMVDYSGKHARSTRITSHLREEDVTNIR